MADSRRRVPQRVAPSPRRPASAVPSHEVERAANDAPPPPSSLIRTVLGAPGGPLLVLRAFLGITFCFAGLQKLANPNFFSATAAGSFVSQVRGAILTSPLHHLLSPALHAPTLFAVVISLGELAVGLGTLLGLFARVAALCGMLLSLTFFLVVSFNDNPYYYGPDIVFLFAWTPLLLGGAGAYSLDDRFGAALRALRAARPGARRPPTGAARRREAELERRTFIKRASVAGFVGAVALLTGGVVAVIGRALRGGSGSDANALTTPSTSTSVPAKGSTGSESSAGGSKGSPIGPASAVPVRGAANFTDPASGVPALVLQPQDHHFVAFSAVCPHAGCTVAFYAPQDIIACPCHGSTFNAVTGAVEGGPSPTGLSPIAVSLGSNGQLYVDG